MKIAIADDSCVFAQRTEQIVKKYFEAKQISSKSACFPMVSTYLLT